MKSISSLAAITLILSVMLVGPASADDSVIETAPAPALQPVDAAEVLQMATAHGEGAVLLNMWATWCQPCREEMPDLVRLQRDFGSNGFKLILVSADFSRQREQAAEFLGNQGVDFQTYIKDQKDNEFINAIDPDWTGALPYSVLYDGNGNVIQRWEGKLSYDEVSRLLREQASTTDN